MAGNYYFLKPLRDTARGLVRKKENNKCVIFSKTRIFLPAVYISSIMGIKKLDKINFSLKHKKDKMKMKRVLNDHVANLNKV